nr:basic 7S globulin-like [Tanacetum cinerariifolium]
STHVGCFLRTPVIKNGSLSQSIVDTVGLSVIDGYAVTGEVDDGYQSKFEDRHVNAIREKEKEGFEVVGVENGFELMFIDLTLMKYASLGCLVLPFHVVLGTECEKSDCFNQPGPCCHINSCGLFPENPVIKNGSLSQAIVDTVGLSVTDGYAVTGEVGIVPNFVLSCSDSSLLCGLPDCVSGLTAL